MSDSETSNCVPCSEPQPPTEEDTRELRRNKVLRRLNVEEINHMFNFCKLIRELDTREKCLAFAEENGMIPVSKECRVHRKPMLVVYLQNGGVGSFICHKGKCHDKSRIQRSKGTWFENAKISLPRVFYLMYCYAHRWSYDTVMHEDPEKSVENGCLSQATIANWYSRSREAVVLYQLSRQAEIGKIGGPGKIVQIDESQFGNKKFDNGGILEGLWVLGLIEDGSEDLRLEICPENIRSAETLVPLIKKHVAEGTTIYTDSWSAYDCLEEHGFIHPKVNHSVPHNPSVASPHTQRIKSQWRVLKQYFRTNTCISSENFADAICEYLWRRFNERNKKDPFKELIKAINYAYKK